MSNCEPSEFQYKRHYESEDQSSDPDMELRCAVVIGRTILHASDMLSRLSADPIEMALETVAEQLAVTDLEAARRARRALVTLGDRLARAIANAQLTHLLETAIVQAAAALPDSRDDEAA